MRFGLFGKGKDAAEKTASAEAAVRIKAEIRDLLGLSADAAIAVNEIICADPACPGMETVILVMEPGRKTEAFKVQRAMLELSRQDLAQALAETPKAAPR